jgi:hypothetical protein
MRTRHVPHVGLVAVMILLVACNNSSPAPTAMPTQVPEPSETPTLTQTATPTMTPTATPTPTATATATPVPSPTPLPEDLRDEILQSYGNIVLIQAEAEMLEELAIKVREGELEGFDSFASLLVLAAFMQAMDENLPVVEPIEPLADVWDDMLTVHARSKDLTARWFNEEIESTGVIEELERVLQEADETAARSEQMLIREYGLPEADLEEWRRDTVDELSGIFESTPTATPGS